MTVKVYILKLKSGRLYVGQSTDPRRRFFEHQSGKGANICKHDSPQEILFQADTGYNDSKLTRTIEDICTILSMYSFGAYQVYGGSYCDEQYRRASEEWIFSELIRLNHWFATLQSNNGEKTMQEKNILETGVIDEFFFSFNTWRTERAAQIENDVES